MLYRCHFSIDSTTKVTTRHIDSRNIFREFRQDSFNGRINFPVNTIPDKLQFLIKLSNNIFSTMFRLSLRRIENLFQFLRRKKRGIPGEIRQDGIL